jgi:hypothetical protein
LRAGEKENAQIINSDNLLKTALYVIEHSRRYSLFRTLSVIALKSNVYDCS